MPALTGQKSNREVTNTPGYNGDLFKELDKAMAPHSSTLAWNITWMEEPRRVQSMGSLSVKHDWAISLFTFMHWRRKWQPTPVFLPGESPGQGSLVGCRLWVAQSRTGLKRLSSSSSRLQDTLQSHNFTIFKSMQWLNWSKFILKTNHLRNNYGKNCVAFTIV